MSLIIDQILSFLSISMFIVWVATYFITTRYIQKKQTGLIPYNNLAKKFRIPEFIYITHIYCLIIFHKKIQKNLKLSEKFLVKDFMSFIRVRDKVNAALVCISLDVFLFLLILNGLYKRYPETEIWFKSLLN